MRATIVALTLFLASGLPRLMREMTLRWSLLFLFLLAIGIPSHGETAREREAFEYLRTTSVFESPHIGYGDVFSKGYLALRIVNRSEDADLLFRLLILQGDTAGQLYGLIGIYQTDPAYFRSIAPRFASRRDRVTTDTGCVMGEERVGKIVTVDHALVVRDGESLAEAARRQPNGRTDIAHGGYTAWYLGPDADEREAMRAEAWVVFTK